MRIDTSRHDHAAESEARAEALRDADEFAEWLATDCYMAKPAAWQPVWSEVRLADAAPAFAAYRTADVLALALDQGQRPATRLAALDCLADRYCAARQVSISERASFLAIEMAYSELESA